MKIYKCDYCGKNENQVERLIIGREDAAICDKCIEKCVQIIRDNRKEKTAPPKEAIT